MIKRHGLLIFILSISRLSVAQSFSGPESVEKNTPDGNYFVSNTGPGTILKLLPDGTIQAFASGFGSGPHGLELVGDTLYACDGSYVRIVDRVTGNILNSVNLGASFLNGITHKGAYLFITDFTAKKIYRFNTKTNAYNVMVTGLSKTPNGIIYDDINNRLVFVCWGTSAPVYELSLTDSTTTLLTTTTTGNCDGIAMNCQGDFYVSSWSPGSAIRKYVSNFSSFTAVPVSGLGNPADIYFDKQTDTLFIPNSSANTVSEVVQSSCVTGFSASLADNGFSVYPNPFSTGFSVKATLNAHVEIINIFGQQVEAVVAKQGITFIPANELPAGTYTVKLTFNGGVESFKLIKQ